MVCLALIEDTGVRNVFHKFAVVLSSATVLASACSIALDSAAQAKASTKRHTAARGAYFVPPPPPYQPSVLPEVRAGRVAMTNVQSEAAAVTVQKQENRYRKYVYTRNEADMPTVVQPNRYVSYWNKS